MPDPTTYPLTAAYFARHGRLPSFSERWGRVPTRSNSWPEKLLKKGGGPSAFSSVTITLPRLPEKLNQVVRGAQSFVLMEDVLRGILRPSLGRLEWEYGPNGRGWHLHGVLSAADVERLSALEGVEVHSRPIKTKRQFLKACRYSNKKVRADATEEERWEVCEALIYVQMVKGRLIPLSKTFGV